MRAIVSIVVLLAACSNTPADEGSPISAVVGFRDAVNTSLLVQRGAVVLEVTETPPQAFVRADAPTLVVLEGHPEIAFVTYNADQDSIVAFVEFADRTSGTTPLSQADHDAVSAVGGRVKHVYDIIPLAAVRLPRGALPALRDDPAVTSAVEVTGSVHIQ